MIAFTRDECAISCHARMIKPQSFSPAVNHLSVKITLELFLLVNSCNDIYGLACLVVLVLRNQEFGGLRHKVSTNRCDSSLRTCKNLDTKPILRHEPEIETG